jgi:hypothetical protein
MDLWIATRPSRTAMFNPPVNLSGINSVGDDSTPQLSSDGLTLYFYSTRTTPGSLYRSQRASTEGTFINVAMLPGQFSQFTRAGGPEISRDELTLYFDAVGGGGPGGIDIWVATRTSRSDPFGAPALVPGVNTAANDHQPFLETNGLALYFMSNRDEVQNDLFLVTRPDLSSAFSAPAKLTMFGLSPGVGEYGADISEDGTTMVLSIDSGAPQSSNIWMATRACL